MEANDLRIGNYLDNPHWEIPKRVAEIRRSENYPTGTSSSVTDDVRCEDTYLAPIGGFCPIPLTVEWLLKFGFDNKSTYFGIKTGWYQHSHNDEPKQSTLKLRILRGKLMVISPGNGSIHIEHVHQLQNLYHSLTGKELTLKQSE